MLRQRGYRRIVHFMNRSSGNPNEPNAAAVGNVFPVGPMTVEVDCAEQPKGISLACEDAPSASLQSGVACKL